MVGGERWEEEGKRKFLGGRLDSVGIEEGALATFPWVNGGKSHHMWTKAREPVSLEDVISMFAFLIPPHCDWRIRNTI